MFSRVFGGVVVSLDTYLIEIEVEHKNGFPGFEIVGLPDAAIKEAKNRIIQAIRYSGLGISFRKILCNLAPADIKKNGTFLDLPIALGLLASSGVLEPELFTKTLIVGELGFAGKVRPVRGALPLAILARELGFDSMILPEENLDEVKVIDRMDYYPVETLNEAIEAVRGEKEPFERGDFYFKETAYPLDFSEVKGQSLAKRGMEIAAAGFHNILLMGSPGVGKTMLAKRLPGIMPMLSMEEAIDVTRIYSVAPGKSVYQKGLITQRPFRSPHHTSSEVSITGGGSIPKPGEVSLAHHGILFLDELPEFKRNVFEVLREPLEEKQITVSRSEKVQTFPADFVLVAAMNPCPCGYAFHPVRSCQCNANQVKNYLRKVSGPILDRIDLQIQMAEVAYKEIERKEESSETVRQRVLHAIEKQKERQGKWNSTLSTGEIEKYCVLSASSRSLIRQAMERLGFSMRGYTKVLKIARTVADLAGADSVGEEHLLEALQFRSLEKQFGTVFQI